MSIAEVMLLLDWVFYRLIRSFERKSLTYNGSDVLRLEFDREFPMMGTNLTFPMAVMVILMNCYEALMDCYVG